MTAAGARTIMTTTVNEPSGWPGSVEDGQRPEPAGIERSYPGYRSTALLDRLRATEYSYLDAGGHTYHDYTGAGLPAQAQLNAHTERLRGGCFGNPHSENPTSAASTELIERARLAVLAHVNAPPDEYGAIFTPNASGACRLVGEAYPFGRRTPAGPDGRQPQLGQRPQGVRQVARRGHAVRAVLLTRAADRR
jgi:hypothetical protein